MCNCGALYIFVINACYYFHHPRYKYYKTFQDHWGCFPLHYKSFNDKSAQYEPYIAHNSGQCLCLPEYQLECGIAKRESNDPTWK